MKAQDGQASQGQNTWMTSHIELDTHDNNFNDLNMISIVAPTPLVDRIKSQGNVSKMKLKNTIMKEIRGNKSK